MVKAQKKTTPSQPPLSSPPITTSAPAPVVTSPAPHPPAPSDEAVVATDHALSVPLANAVAERSYIGRHLDVHLSRDQATTLHRLFRALHDRHARLDNGRHIDRPADAVRYLLEQLGAVASDGRPQPQPATTPET